MRIVTLGLIVFGMMLCGSVAFVSAQLGSDTIPPYQPAPTANALPSEPPATDPADLPPAVLPLPALPAEPVSSSQSMVLRLQRKQDIVAIPSTVAASTQNYGAVPKVAVQTNHTGLWLRCKAVSVRSQMKGDKIEYQLECNGPVSIIYGNKRIEAASIRFANNQLQLTDAKIDTGDLRMKATEFAIEFELAKLEIGAMMPPKRRQVTVTPAEYSQPPVSY